MLKLLNGLNWINFGKPFCRMDAISTVSLCDSNPMFINVNLTMSQPEQLDEHCVSHNK